MIEGVDVSHHQGVIDWPAVAAAGIGFAYLKASESVGFIDGRFRHNREAATAAGLTVGAYHFARPRRGREAAAREAGHFHAVVGDTAGELAPALDLEVDGGLTPSELAVWVRQFLDVATERFGRRPAVYASPGWWDGNVSTAVGSLDEYPLWVAHWDVATPRPPRAWSTYAVHQYTSDGRVPGIAGRCDRDRAHSIDALLDQPKEAPMPPAPEHPTVRFAAPLASPPLYPTPSGRGYWMVSQAGEVAAFGDAVYVGRVEAPLSTHG